MTEKPKPELPGNHGQFGEDAATEKFERLQDAPPPKAPAPEAPKQTGAGERS